MLLVFVALCAIDWPGIAGVTLRGLFRPAY
jgi:hypothetical protein